MSANVKIKKNNDGYDNGMKNITVKKMRNYKQSKKCKTRFKIRILKINSKIIENNFMTRIV